MPQRLKISPRNDAARCHRARAGGSLLREEGAAHGVKPVYQVGGKSFVLFRNPRPDAFDPDTGQRYDDVIVWVLVVAPDQEDGGELRDAADGTRRSGALEPVDHPLLDVGPDQVVEALLVAEVVEEDPVVTPACKAMPATPTGA